MIIVILILLFIFFQRTQMLFILVVEAHKTVVVNSGEYYDYFINGYLLSKLLTQVENCLKEFEGVLSYAKVEGASQVA